MNVYTGHARCKQLAKYFACSVSACAAGTSHYSSQGSSPSEVTGHLCSHKSVWILLSHKSSNVWLDSELCNYQAEKKKKQNCCLSKCLSLAFPHISLSMFGEKWYNEHVTTRLELVWCRHEASRFVERIQIFDIRLSQNMSAWLYLFTAVFYVRWYTTFSLSDLLYINCSFVWRQPYTNSLTFWEICVFAYCLRVRWEDQSLNKTAFDH